jgi:hypothetical protein
VSDTIEIPAPVIRVVTTSTWKAAGFTGYREYVCRIEVGDVVVLERKGDDEEDYRMSEDMLRERTVSEFGKRLKEVLGL